MRNERIIYVFLLSAVLLVAGGFFLPKPQDDKLIQDRFWVKKTHGNNDFDIIIMGDSRAYRGISPEAMQKHLPDCKILNFGYSSGRINKFMCSEAEKRIALGRKKTVILAISPNTLIPPPVENAHYLEQYLLPKEEIYQRLYFAPLLHFFSSVKPSEIFSGKSRKDNNYIQKYYDNGFVASHKLKEDTTEALKTYEKWFKEAAVSRKMIKDLLEQTEDWTKRGITVIAFRIPSSYSMEKLEDSLAGFNELELKDLFLKAGGIWLDFPKNQYHSYDGSHLHFQSAERLSEELGLSIKNLLENSSIN
ncbi:MAG: hypothetical protein JXR58_08690 [Bacteroidales bacterium]|nr:hypothetical protein [Bacteroidales bacterium]